MTPERAIRQPLEVGGTGEASAGRAGPVYIGGLDRSGKTTLYGFLTSHPCIAIPPAGTNMWTFFYGQFGNLAQGDNLDRCLSAMLAYSHIRALEPDAARIRRAFADGPQTYARLFSLFLEHYAEREGKPRWGAQTGLIERYADPILQQEPAARIVHMLRDPRDRYAASLEQWPQGRGGAGTAAARWAYSTRLAHRHLRRYPDRYLIVRFEDLVLDTETTVRRVCRFLDAEFQPAMLEMAGAPERRERLRSRVSHGRPETILSAEHLGRYRAVLGETDLAFLQLHLGRLMRRHGYTLDPLGLRPPDWARFAVADWPGQVARLAAWRAREVLQQRLPAVARRRPDRRTVVADGDGGAA